jgi:hypothetical protein
VGGGGLESVSSVVSACAGNMTCLMTGFTHIGVETSEATIARRWIFLFIVLFTF